VQPGERVLVPGVGTGMGLAALPYGAHITASDLSPAMLAQARRKLAGKAAVLEVMDAQRLRYPDARFDAILMSLILSVVPDSAAAFREAWRVLRPGGRAVIFDKFLPEHGWLSLLRRAVGWAARAIGTDPNRRLSEIIAGASDLVVERNEASLLRGQYRIVLLRKHA
jgi:phosphatidylethanolamine/phosphatidyl-N-methylethanolamine N-methyltransferase